MTRKEVYLLIKSAADSLPTQHEFGRGRVSEFSALNKQFPVVWFETSPVSPELNSAMTTFIDSWEIPLHIGKIDKEDSLPEQYEAIIDDCDQIAQTLQFKINQVVSGSNLLTISGISRTPFIKKHASSVTGVLLNFTLTSPDTTPQDC